MSELRRIGFIIFLILSIVTHKICASEFCAQKNGLAICVEHKGVAPISELIPSENGAFYLDIFLIKLKNLSTDTITIRPEDFYCTTLSGRALVIDKPLYDKITWPGKLEEYELLPMEEIERFIFFPASRDYVRSIIHRIPPVIEIKLY